MITHKINNLKYSENEVKLFEELGQTKNLYVFGSPFKLYSYSAEDAFLNEQNGPAADALRRGFKALRDSTCYIMTEEFDELIRMTD